jgi:hypothetical protein
MTGQLAQASCGNQSSMTRRAQLLSCCAVACGYTVLGGCRAETLSFAAQSISAACGDAGFSPGPIGTPCAPLGAERDSTFVGFNKNELELATCQPEASGVPVCLAFHFQGRATCPYGQDANGRAPSGASPCKTPEGQPVTGAVEPQCVDRQASKVIFWSCRCANDQGLTNDGSSYCTCPGGTACTQVISSLGGAGAALAGAFCVRSDVAFDPNSACQTVCEPTAHPCP